MGCKTWRKSKFIKCVNEYLEKHDIVDDGILYLTKIHNYIVKKKYHFTSTNCHIVIELVKKNIFRDIKQIFDYDDIDIQLEQNENVHQYNQLVESSKAKVAQAENTFIIEKDKVIKTSE